MRIQPIYLALAIVLLCPFASAQWVQTSGPEGGRVRSLAASGTNLYVGTQGCGVFVSSNNGTSWTAANYGLGFPDVYALAVTSDGAGGTKIYAGTYGDGVYTSVNNGASWHLAMYGLTNYTTLALVGSDTNLFAGTAGGVFHSTDGGASWAAVNSGLTNTQIQALAFSGANLLSGTGGGGVFLSTNNGTNWTAVSSGLTRPNVWTLAVSSTNLYAGIYGSGVFRRPLSEMITSVEPATSELPRGFQLQQNYPNPFNPSTTIRYGLPTRSHVTLSVYNTLGQQVATLVKDEQEARYHEVKFDGSGLASGVYFYRIQAGSFAQTKKLLILR